MTILYINTGSSANAGDGDTLRTAFNKVNANFTYLSTASFSGGGGAGAPGPSGPRGPQGVAGNTGPQGPQGPGADQRLNTTSSVTFTNITIVNTATIPSLRATAATVTTLNANTVTSEGGFFFNLSANGNTDLANLNVGNNAVVSGVLETPSALITKLTATNAIIDNLTAPAIRSTVTTATNLFATLGTVNTLTVVNQAYVSNVNVTSTATFSGNAVFANTASFRNILPSADATYNLGSPTQRWKNLYVSTSTVYLANDVVAVADGKLTLNGAPVLGTATTTVLGGVKIGHNLAATAGGTLTSYQSVVDIAPPYDAQESDQWFDAVGGKQYVFYQGYWVETNLTGVGDPGARGPSGPVGPKGNTGDQGISVTLVGSTATSAGLPLTGNAGDGWIVNDTGDLWFWSTANSQWEDIGQIVGPQGDPGDPGPEGPSGPSGPSGPIGYQGASGPSGADSTVAGPSGPSGAQGDPGANADFNYLDAFQLSSTYAKNDIVTYDGASYVAKGTVLPNVGSPDTNSTDWQLVTARGPSGPQGIQGPQGAQGVSGPSGAQGNAGPSGAQGNDGPSGPSGPQGEQGLPGGNANTADFLFTHSEMIAATNADITMVTNANTWTFAADGTLTAPGHLLPDADLTYDLGSTTTQWRSIYVGTGTIFIGGVALGVNADNFVTVDGNPIITVDTASNLTIPGETDLSIVVGGGSLGNVEVAEVDEWVPPGGPGGVWRLFIVVEDYPTLGDIVQIGDTFTTSWGTPITATITDIVQDSGDWKIHVEQDITAGFNYYDTVTFSSVSGKTWTFSTDGNLTFPQGTLLGYSDPGGFIIDGAVDKDIAIYTYSGADAHGWTFGTDGVLTFPNGDLTIGYNGASNVIEAASGTLFTVLGQGPGGAVGFQWISDTTTSTTSAAAVILNSPFASNSGTVQIATGAVTGPVTENTWEFGADGNLTIPDDIQDANGSVVRVATTSTAPTRVDGQLWFDNQEGRLYIKNDGLWLDASPTQIPSPETYLDGLAIDGTVIGTANVNGDAIVIDGGDNTKLTVSNNSVTIQVPGTLTRTYWAAEFGGITTAVTTSSIAIGTGAFYDSVGNVYVLGGVQFDSTSTFGLDSLLLKYDTNGNLLWSRTWHDDSGANCGAINQAFAIDSNDRIYWLATAVEEGFGCWTGYMDTEGNLGLGGVAQASLGFLNGTFAGADIACDNSGNYYLAGVSFDYINNTETPVVIKVDGDSGVPIWTGNIVPEDFESLPSNGTYRAVTVNPATGDVWAIGDYYDGGLRAMLSKWDINGSHQWTKELVTTTGDVASAVIYNGGYVYTIVNDDPDQKAVVSKFDTDGVLIWASFLAVGVLDPIPSEFGSYSTGAYDLSFDSAGNVYVTGTIPYGTELPQLWITKLDPANGEMLYSRMLATTEGSLIIDQGVLGSSLVGHRVGDIYQDTIVVTAITPSDIDDSTGTNALRVMVAQLPIDGSVTGTFDNINIVNITGEIDSVSSTGTYTVTTLAWSIGTSTAITSTSSISVSYVTDVIGLTGETIALGSGTASGSTTTNTWTFVNNNIILPPGGDILDSNGVSVLGATSTSANGWQLTSSTAVVSLTSDGTLTLPGGSIILDGMGAIRLEPSGASSSTQALLIYPTAGDGNHIHLTAGGGETDLYLGSDIQYVKVDHGGSIVIGAVGANTSTWTFGTDGVLTLSTAGTILGNSEDPNVYIETATTATTSTWTFGTNGILTLPAATPVIKGGGTGTDVTIVASTGSNTSTWVFAADGGITFPDSTVQTTAWPGGNNSSVSTTANNSNYFNIGNFINNGSLDINYTAFTGDYGIDFDISYQAPLDGTKGVTVGAVETPLILSTGTVILKTDISSSTSTWTFGTDGGLTFPDATVQTTAWTGTVAYSNITGAPTTSAYASTYTGWFEAAGTVVQLDTLLARINSTGTMQISTTIIETPGQGSAFAWNGIRNRLTTMSSFGQGGTNWVNPGDWLDISATPLNNDFEVATVNIFKLGGTGSLYRITYVGATTGNWSVSIERVGLGTA